MGAVIHSAATGVGDKWLILAASRKIPRLRNVRLVTDQSSGGASFGTMSVPSFVMRKAAFAFLSQWPPTDAIALPVLVRRRSRSHWPYSAYGPWTNVFRPGGYCSNIQYCSLPSAHGP